MEKLKKILSPTHDAADKQDSHGSGAAGAVGAEKRTELNQDPNQASSVNPPADSAQAADSSEAGLAKPPSKAEKLLGSSFSQVHDTGSSATGPRTTNIVDPFVTDDHPSDGGFQHGSGDPASPIASRDPTGNEATTRPFAGPKGSSQPLPSAGPKGSSQPLPVAGPKGSAQPLPAAGPKGSSQPLPDPKNTNSQIQGLNASSEPRYGHTSLAPGGKDDMGPGGTLAAREDDDPATTGLAAGSHTDDRVNPGMTESEDQSASMKPIPGSFPEQTPTEPPPFAEYFNTTDRSQNTPSSVPTPTPKPIASIDNPTTKVGTSGIPTRDGQSGPLAAGTSTASTTPVARPWESSTTTGAPTGHSSEVPTSRPTEKPEDSHGGQYAAMGAAAAAGAGAGAIGAHEYSQRKPAAAEPEPFPAERSHEQPPEYKGSNRQNEEPHQASVIAAQGMTEKDHSKAVKKEEKKAEKEEKKAEKEHDKAVEKEEKKAEKEGRKAEKEHEKAVLKEEKKADKEHEKFVKKEEKRADKDYSKALIADEKETEDEQKKAMMASEGYGHDDTEKNVLGRQDEEEKRRDSDEKDKKKGGLLGIFRRRRDSKGNEVEDEGEDASSPSSGQRNAKDKRHGMNKLTKAPPPGLYDGDPATPAHADYAVKENNHPGAQTITGGYTAPDAAHDKHKYHGTAAGAGKTMPPTEQSLDSHHAPDTQQFADAKMKGESHESQYSGGGGGTAPATLTKGGSGSTGAGGDRSEYRSTGGTGSAKDDNNIVLHSDGTRRYEDGSMVDPPQRSSGQYGAASQDSPGHGDGHEGGHPSKMDKMLEKLHLKKGDESHPEGEREGGMTRE